jgi:hypothetical protein
MNMNNVDVKAQILRMRKHLMEQRGFPEDKIILIIEDDEDTKPTATNKREHIYTGWLSTWIQVTSTSLLMAVPMV